MAAIPAPVPSLARVGERATRRLREDGLEVPGERQLGNRLSGCGINLEDTIDVTGTIHEGDPDTRHLCPTQTLRDIRECCAACAIDQHIACGKKAYPPTQG